MLPSYPKLGSDTQKFASDQAAWALQAVVVYDQEKIMRKATAQCLANLRAKGLIN